MLFNSIQYLIFFPIVTLLFYLIKGKSRCMLLLGASYFFYICWNPAYIILILLSTITDYIVAIMIEQNENTKRKKLWLALSLFVNLGLLFTFKYYNFFSGTLNKLLDLGGWAYQLPCSRLLLPVGISFYTFQTISYTLDVYRGTKKAEKHFGYFALYVSFFPQLVAGPIERSSHLLPQLKEGMVNQNFNHKMTAAGLRLMLWGFFKKVVIADRLGVVVNTIYNNPGNYTGPALILGTLFFAFQIFCDFSGYSDIAIGSAGVLGIKLMKNFDTPYFSGSVGEFWRRWHISLSSWFKEYLYIPLGGNRSGEVRGYINLMITFIISGIWHGASWTFVIWGGINGLLLVFSRLTSKIRKRLVPSFMKDTLPYRLFRVMNTFILINITWIFFRANTPGDAFYILTNLFNFQEAIDPLLMIKEKGLIPLLMGRYYGLPRGQFFIAILSLITLVITQLLSKKGELKLKLENSIILRWAVTYGLLFTVITFSQISESRFIYFQF